MPADDGNVMSLSWAFGFSRDVTVHNLCDDNRAAIFYVSAHTGVIYDLTSKSQQLLQGHCRIAATNSRETSRGFHSGTAAGH